MTVLDRISSEAMAKLAQIPGAVDIDRNLKAAKPMFNVRVKRDVASDLGVGTLLIANTLRPLFAGDETSLWKAPDDENYTVMVRLSATDRTGKQDLDRVWLATAQMAADGSPRMV